MGVTRAETSAIRQAGRQGDVDPQVVHGAGRTRGRRGVVEWIWICFFGCCVIIVFLISRLAGTHAQARRRATSEQAAAAGHAVTLVAWGYSTAPPPGGGDAKEPQVRACVRVCVLVARRYSTAPPPSGGDAEKPQPDREVVLRVSVPDPGYHATAIYLAQAGLSLLTDRGQLPAPGVHTLGAIERGRCERTHTRVRCPVCAPMCCAPGPPLLPVLACPASTSVCLPAAAGCPAVRHLLPRPAARPRHLDRGAERRPRDGARVMRACMRLHI
jgi:hypothetical protein